MEKPLKYPPHSKLAVAQNAEAPTHFDVPSTESVQAPPTESVPALALDRLKSQRQPVPSTESVHHRLSRWAPHRLSRCNPETCTIFKSSGPSAPTGSVGAPPTESVRSRAIHHLGAQEPSAPTESVHHRHSRCSHRLSRCNNAPCCFFIFSSRNSSNSTSLSFLASPSLQDSYLVVSFTSVRHTLSFSPSRSSYYSLTPLNSTAKGKKKTLQLI